MNACILETNVSTLPFIVHTLEKTCTTQILYKGKKKKKTVYKTKRVVLTTYAGDVLQLNSCKYNSLIKC